MRALLVVNPSATATTPRGRDVLARALGSDLKVDVAETTARGHARTLARQAVEDGLELVVALGGDGTVNEVVDGLLADGPSPGPALAVVPGGNANVFARALGLPRSPVEATGHLLEALSAGRERVLGLGQLAVDDGPSRWFTFCAGVGWDAEVVREVDRRRRAGATATPGLFARTAVRRFYGGTERRVPPLTLSRPGLPDLSGLHLAVLTNTSPWTYLGARPLRPTPRARFDTGVDALVLRRLTTPVVARTLVQMFGTGHGPRGAAVEVLHDQAQLDLESLRPVAVQIDGELLGDARRVSVRSVPAALRVVC